MNKTLSIIGFILIVTVLCQDSWTSVDYGGAQIIDSTLSYANNLRIPSTNKLWFKADKRKPNVYYAVSAGASGFKLLKKSQVNDKSLPFFSFDVLTVKGIDYLIGPTYGTLAKDNFGMVLQVSDSDNRTTVLNTDENFFYSVWVDPKEPEFTDIHYFFYMVGFRYSVAGSDSRGIVLSRASAALTDVSDVQIVFKNEENSFCSIEKGCYDIWTETNKPAIFSIIKDASKYLLVVLPGKCTSVTKVLIPDTTSPMPACTSVKLPNIPVNDCKITSSAFVPSTDTLYIACKVYNAEQSYLYAVNTNTMQYKSVDGLKLNSNESTPILTFDNTTGSLFVATSGFNKIYRYDANLKQTGVAVLPYPLKSVASMIVTQGYIYLATYEPNAQLGRISTSNFCDSFCSDYGYCDGANGRVCACIAGYSKDPEVKDSYVCSPTHIIEYQNTIIAERGAAATFGVLFAFAIIVGVIGWFMWFKRQSYQPITK
jgi:hypothetical protein